MGLFGNRKIKIAPEDFVKRQLDLLFSSDNEIAIKTLYQELAQDYPLIKKAEFSKYLKETLYVHTELFSIAWNRTMPSALFVKYSGLVGNDPRVKAIDSGVFHEVLSSATEAGMGTFEYIAFTFLTLLMFQQIDINDPELERLVIEHSSQFSGLYNFLVERIKEFRFI